MIKKQYTMPLDEAKLVPKPPEGWKSARPLWLQPLEEMLRYLKQDSVRSALAASIPSGAETKAAERRLRIRVLEMNLMVVTAFEDT